MTWKEFAGRIFSTGEENSNRCNLPLFCRIKRLIFVTAVLSFPRFSFARFFFFNSTFELAAEKNDRIESINDLM